MPAVHFLAMESMNVRRDWLAFQSGSQSGSGKKKRKYILPLLFSYVTYYSKFGTFVLFRRQSLKGTFLEALDGFLLISSL
jgi:hypothetical protein